MSDAMGQQKDRSGVSAIVLAAGLSTRMGAVKPLVTVRGRMMLERVLSTLRESRVDGIIVVLGDSADLVQQSIMFGNATVVVNESYREGIASSLQTGLSHVTSSAEAALIVLADQPFLKAQTIDLLIDEYCANKSKIVLPTCNGIRGNPVLFDRSVFPELAQLTGDTGARAIFKRHLNTIAKVPVDDEGVLVDLDTPAEVERLDQAGGQ
jgi:molybdenum cofactor cytidylyltransferase